MKNVQSILNSMFLMYEGLCKLNELYPDGLEELTTEAKKVICGKSGEGYTMERCYVEDSINEEVAGWWFFLNDFCEEYKLDWVRFRYEELKVESTDNLELVLGLSLLAKGMEQLAEESRNNSEIREILMKFETKEVDFNPFQKYGFYELEKKINGWKRATFKELKDELGRKKIETIKSDVEDLLSIS